MTTDTIDKPKAKRKYNRINPHPTPKIPIQKVTELLGNHKLSVQEAAKILDCHPQSIYKALARKEIVISDYDIQSIKDSELDELYIITHEARQHLYKLLMGGKLKGIETTAILDRCFQQRRELQGKAHSSINIFTLIVQKADEQVLNITPTSTISSISAVESQPIAQPQADNARDCQDKAT